MSQTAGAAPTAPPRSSSPLRSAFANLPTSEHPAQWDSFYRQGHHPWDRSGPSTALRDLLVHRSDLVPPSQDLDNRGLPLRSETGSVVRRTALVPGCGRGHDVLLLASLGYDVWGLDVSEKGLDMARENEKQAEAEGLYKEPAKRGGDHDHGAELEKGTVHWVAGDFFDGGWLPEGKGQFDLIFDYTFLCALPPDMRPKWAQRMDDLLSPEGRLVCLEFPSGKPLRDGGPPWGLNPEVYEALLAAPGEPVQYDEAGDGSVVSLPSPKPRDDAIRRLSLIKPARTHKAGTNEDGTVKDFISVWRR